MSNNIDNQKITKPRKSNLKFLPKKIRPKYIIVGLSFLVVLGLIISSYLLYSRATTKRDSAYAKQQADQYEKQGSEISKALDGDVAGAVATLQNKINIAGSVEDKVNIMNELTVIYISTEKYQEAIAYGKKTIAIQNNAQSWSLLVQGYEGINDLPMAIAAYEQAIKLSEDSKDDARGNYAQYTIYLTNAKAKYEDN